MFWSKIGPKGPKKTPKSGFRRFSQLFSIRNRWFCIFKLTSIVFNYWCNKIGWKNFFVLKFCPFRPKLGPKWRFLSILLACLLACLPVFLSVCRSLVSLFYGSSLSAYFVACFLACCFCFIANYLNTRKSMPFVHLSNSLATIDPENEIEDSVIIKDYNVM